VELAVGLTGRCEMARKGWVFICLELQFDKVCCTGLFISPSGISEIDCATTKTDTAESSISIGREILQDFFCTRGLGLRHNSWVFLQGTTMPSLCPIHAAAKFGTWALH
jgi:hypothetical protein